MTAAASALAVRPAPALLKADGARYTWLELVQSASDGVRETIMMNGTAPYFDSLSGWEFRGANGSVLTRLIGIRKFVKGFYDGADLYRSGPQSGPDTIVSARRAGHSGRDRSPRGPTPHMHGYNITVRQNADGADHVYAPSAERPKRHGYYRVHRPLEDARDNRYPNALLLDYSLGGNGLFGPPLRDYLVQVYPDDEDLLLGKAYVALGPIRVPVGFFILERLKKHDHRG